MIKVGRNLHLTDIYGYGITRMANPVKTTQKSSISRLVPQLLHKHDRDDGRFNIVVIARRDRRG